MITLKFENKEAWLAGRRGKIGGSTTTDVISKKAGSAKKAGYYKLIAEKLAIAPDNENPMFRGTRLEDEAVARFEQATGKKVDRSLVIWTRDDNDDISISPDGFIEDTEALAVATTGTRESITEAAVECKCRNSEKHIEAWLKQEIPPEYQDQVIQYFVVNDMLTTLYFVFFDPRIPCKEFFYFTVTRDQVQDKVTDYLEQERKLLEEVNKVVSSLTF